MDTLTKVTNKREMLNICIKLEERNLIDRAAQFTSLSFTAVANRKYFFDPEYLTLFSVAAHNPTPPIDADWEKIIIRHNIGQP